MRLRVIVLGTPPEPPGLLAILTPPTKERNTHHQREPQDAEDTDGEGLGQKNLCLSTAKVFPMKACVKLDDTHRRNDEPQSEGREEKKAYIGRDHEVSFRNAHIPPSGGAAEAPGPAPGRGGARPPPPPSAQSATTLSVISTTISSPCTSTSIRIGIPVVRRTTLLSGLYSISLKS